MCFEKACLFHCQYHYHYHNLSLFVCLFVFTHTTTVTAVSTVSGLCLFNCNAPPHTHTHSHTHTHTHTYKHWMVQFYLVRKGHLYAVKLYALSVGQCITTILSMYSYILHPVLLLLLCESACYLTYPGCQTLLKDGACVHSGWLRRQSLRNKFKIFACKTLNLNLLLNLTEMLHEWI